MNPNLLLAEGDTELRRLYGSFLARNGYEVVVAANGLDCLQKLSANNPDLLVLDLELIWGGGDGVLAWLREQSAPSKVSVIVTATASSSVDDADVIEPPVVEFLPKPFGLTALLRSVNAAVARKGREEPLSLDRDDTCSGLYIG